MCAALQYVHQRMGTSVCSNPRTMVHVHSWLPVQFEIVLFATVCETVCDLRKYKNLVSPNKFVTLSHVWICRQSLSVSSCLKWTLTPKIYTLWCVCGCTCMLVGRRVLESDCGDFRENRTACHICVKTHEPEFENANCSAAQVTQNSALLLCWVPLLHWNTHIA